MTMKCLQLGYIANKGLRVPPTLHVKIQTRSLRFSAARPQTGRLFFFTHNPGYGQQTLSFRNDRPTKAVKRCCTAGMIQPDCEGRTGRGRHVDDTALCHNRGDLRDAVTTSRGKGLRLYLPRQCHILETEQVRETRANRSYGPAAHLSDENLSKARKSAFLCSLLFLA